MVAFGGVVVYETPDKKRWVAFEDYDRLRKRATLKPYDVAVVEWAIEMLAGTADELEGNWDSEKTKRDCDNVRKAVTALEDILERLS